MYMYSFCFCKILCSSISFNNFWILGWATLFYCCTPWDFHIIILGLTEPENWKSLSLKSWKWDIKNANQRKKCKFSQNVQVKKILILIWIIFFRVHLCQLVLMIVQISMNTTAMGKKDILNSQIKTEVKSFCQMTFIMFKLMFILYTIINAGFLNFIVNLHSTKLIFANRGLYYVACCKSP